MFSLSNIYDLSFVTSKKRILGPMKNSDLPLSDGLTLKIPSKLKHLEKNCPGSFYWLQGFGSETIKVADKEDKKSLFPIWGFKAHFKVYPVKKQDEEFEFLPGYKKHFQFSIDGLSTNPVVEDLEDLQQLEKPPVQEVVDLDDSEEEDEESEEEDQGMAPGVISNNDDSIMVVDSDDDEENEHESEEEGGYSHGMAPHNFGGKGGEDEPIEIESSSEEEEEEIGKKKPASPEKRKRGEKENGDKGEEDDKEKGDDEENSEEPAKKASKKDTEKEEEDGEEKNDD